MTAKTDMEFGRDYTVRLPPKFHYTLLELLRDDLRSIRLVNKQWDVVAVSLLWESLTIDLTTPDSSKLNALVDPPTNGFTWLR
ncbi:uncharacterized protein M421DRAFT_6792 [Didymella exigua CBS 183.55]|uniref:Uncharacterized protein n=1 Tax=Didymella exigua CBS 183.55 TaxID=1150837 RepID=A0A6A5RG79_9PLEO|nr:uncharacterized protein M421DRAFT_6792 [Didymella exigua CBS 183.55]KAF1926509.1 hypothetical protein M421DRAFT_6792 [Didymella exigua CBS 183.55]